MGRKIDPNMLLQLGSRKCRRGKRSNAHYGRWVSAEVGRAVPARHDRARLLDFPECPGPRRAGLLYAKVCANREDFWDATGARTFLSAATPEYSAGSERSKALLPFDVAADKNVRAPLWFRLGRPSDRRALPAVIDRLRHLQDCLRAPRMVMVHRD